MLCCWCVLLCWACCPYLHGRTQAGPAPRLRPCGLSALRAGTGLDTLDTLDVDRHAGRGRAQGAALFESPGCGAQGAVPHSD